ncbi:helix-turn-helix transcriptional regulator [Phenylobacterium sp.]|jgi:transcriptional regulator with XRE-family HTH domain|uniref:helix-turn-helix domain-containing protein n=1 Tax=Phenylobacterium sp. TaxID=1871053 RepID=UPI002E345E26|nr:helix-turn-helix transcriptional regulator [Phenylobacterium sp.]HEX3365598.1 helix-turn-helix transcriptional regulator [Phenylobacterium sp.]
MPKSVFSDAYALVIDHLVELRRAQQVSQVELARRIGKTQQWVSFIERRERRLDVVQFYALVKALGGDPEREIVALFRAMPDAVAI